MAIKKVGMSPGGRLETGAAVLAAAEVINSKLIQFIKPRLLEFSAAHRSYVDAQAKVDAANIKFRAAQAELGRCDAEQGEVVEALAGTLCADGQPRSNPFAAFGAAAPFNIKRLPSADEAAAVHELVAAIRRGKNLSKATLEAAAVADKAARAVEAALAPLAKLEEAARNARHTRDAIGQTWETTLAVLRRAARTAEDDGAPGLYAALFGRLGRATKRRSNTDAAAQTPDPNPPATNAPAPVKPA